MVADGDDILAGLACLEGMESGMKGRVRDRQIGFHMHRYAGDLIIASFVVVQVPSVWVCCLPVAQIALAKGP